MLVAVPATLAVLSHKVGDNMDPLHGTEGLWRSDFLHNLIGLAKAPRVA